jgi:ABC-type antimicrobial peptide transport system permease subunit
VKGRPTQLAEADSTREVGGLKSNFHIPQLSRGVRSLINIPFAVAALTFSRTLLYGVTSTDPRVVLGAAGLVALVTLGAGYIPARRATRVDPLIALRDE